MLTDCHPSLKTLAAGKDIFKELAFYVLFAVIASISVSISLFEISVTTFLALSAISFIKSKRWQILKDPFFLLVLLYFVMNVVSLTQTEYWAPSLRGILKVAKGISLCLAAFYVIDSVDKLKKVFQCFLIVALVIAVDGLIQAATGTEWMRGRSMTPYYGDTGRITGPFPHANDFAAYLSFVIFLFIGILRRGRNFFSVKSYSSFILGFLGILLCLMGTYSRGAWVAVGITLFLFGMVTRSKVLISIMLALCLWGVLFAPPLIKMRASSLFSPKDGTVIQRKVVWGESLRMITKSPLFGLGVNTYTKNQPLYASKDSKIDFQYAHNGYLQMAAEIGLLGVLSFLTALIYFLIAAGYSFARYPPSFLKTAGTALLFGIFSFLLHSATDTNLQSILLINTLWLAIGIAWAAKNLCTKSIESSS